MASVKLLLQESIKNVGRVGDVVEVSPGYARNYLLPQGLAVEPTKGNLKKVEARRQEIEKQEREKREQQARLIKQLEGKDVTMERKANDQGHLYGAVSATDIAKALQADGFNVEAEDVLLSGKLDQINTYTVKVRFAEDLETDLKVYVAPDAESKASIDAARKASADAAKAEEGQNA
jgi:large subunit ribosomal protein L9